VSISGACHATTACSPCRDACGEVCHQGRSLQLCDKFSLQVFLTEGYLGIVMEYVNGGDMADLVDTWNARNRRRRPPPGTVPAGTQCASKFSEIPVHATNTCTSACAGCLDMSKPPAVEKLCTAALETAAEQHSLCKG
jgi:hypothetical protein